MSRSMFTLGASPGDRIAYALIVAAFLAEMLIEEWRRGPVAEPAEPMTLAECRETCGEVGDERRIRKLERYSCECVPEPTSPPR